MSGRIPRTPSTRERRWLSAKARRLGSGTAAMVQLVRIAIAVEAEWGDSAAAERLMQRLRRDGVPKAEARRAVRRWRRSRETWRQRRRLINLLVWAFPGDPHYVGRGADDDPRRPLARAATRRLVAAGRSCFDE